MTAAKLELVPTLYFSDVVVTVNRLSHNRVYVGRGSCYLRQVRLVRTSTLNGTIRSVLIIILRPHGPCIIVQSGVGTRV